jgi:fatty-acyl-CoA synthase
VKTDLKKEGFDPGRVSEPLHHLDSSRDAYVALDVDVHARIVAGEIRL